MLTRRPEVSVTSAGEERSCIDRARGGDLGAFESLYRSYMRQVYGVCRRLLDSSQDAEDMTQRAFLRAWQRIDTFRGDSGFGTWLRRIAVHLIVDERRSMWRRTFDAEVGDTAEEMPARTSVPGVALDLERAVRALPPGPRRVLILHDIEGYTHAEVAEALGVTVGTEVACRDGRRIPRPGRRCRPSRPGCSPASRSVPAKEAVKTDENANASGKFVDYNRAISTGRTRHGVEVAFVENEKNDLFQLDVILDMGTDHDRRLGLAAEYANLVGTGRESLDELKRKYYELGLTVSSYATRDRTVFHLEGLQANLEAGIELLDHFLDDVAVDETAHADHVDRLLKGRQARLADVDAIMDQGMLSHALYGERSPLRNALSAAELRETTPAQLAGMIKHLRNHEHRIFYYGRDLRQVIELLDVHYRADPVKPTKPATRFRKRPTPPEVYFVHLDIVQAHAMVVARGEPFDPARIGPSNFYGPYVDHVVFRQVREERALAYSTSAAHIMARRPGEFDYSYAYAGTQADKLPEAVRELIGCMKELPGSEAEMRFVREDQLKRYRAERVTGIDLFWTRERLRKLGIDHDIREDMFAAADGMTLDRLREFFDRNIGGRDVALLVVGNRADVDMDALAAYGEVVELDPKDLFND